MIQDSIDGLFTLLGGTMKHILFMGLFSAFSLGAYAGFDLSDGFNENPKSSYLRTLKSGERIEIDLGRKQYIENIIIFAEGKQSRFSFGKVYADGEEVATLGIPGFDPDYPIVIRGRAKLIEVVASANSKFEILDFKIHTDRKNYASYLTTPLPILRTYSLDNWGKHTLDAVYELFYMMNSEGLISKEDFVRYIVPIRRAAVLTQASDNARSADSIRTYRKAKKLAKALRDAKPLFDKTYMIMDESLDNIVIDLLTIKEDISEKYDVNVE